MTETSKLTKEYFRTLPHVKEVQELCKPEMYTSYYMKYRGLPDFSYELLKRYCHGSEDEWTLLGFFHKDEAKEIVGADIGVIFWH